MILQEFIKSIIEMRNVFFLIAICLLFQSCESEYSKLVKAETSKDEVYTDFFFDLKVGQTKKDFYAICWTLNDQKIISQGPGNNYAKYIINENRDGDTARIEMLFYGIFDNAEKMIGMDIKSSYLSYAPWNEDSHSNQLVESLKKKYILDYPGNDFIRINLENAYGDAWVKVDANRQILMYPLDQKNVAVKIEDLRFKNLKG